MCVGEEVTFSSLVLDCVNEIYLPLLERSLLVDLSLINCFCVGLPLFAVLLCPVKGLLESWNDLGYLFVERQHNKVKEARL